MADSSRVPFVQAGSGDPSRGIQVQVGTTTSADPSRYIPVEIDTTNLDPSRFIRLQSGSGDPSRAVYYYSDAEFINYATLYATPDDIGTVWTGGSGAGGMIVTDTDWNNFITASAAGNITGVVATAHTLTLPKTITNTPSSQVMLRGESSSSKANLCSSSAGVMNSFVFGSTSSNWTLKWLTFGDASGTSGRCLSRTGTTHDNIRIYECEFYSTTLDPNGAYSGGSPTLVYAVGSDGGSDWVNFIFAGNYIHDVYVGVTAGGTQTAVLFNNDFDKVYTDTSGIAATTTNSTKVLFNRFSRPVGLSSDAGNPHVDAIQIATGGAASVRNCEIIGNIIFVYGSRGIFQCIFGNQNVAGYYFTNFKVAGNLIVYDMAVAGSSFHFITLDRIKDSYIFGNVSVTRTPATGIGGTELKIGNNQTSGRNLIGYNVTDGTSIAYAGVQKVGNSELTHSLAQYQSVMSWASDPTSVAECITAAARTAALTGYANYTNFTLKVSDEIGWVPLLSVFGSATSSTVTSNWAKVMGGPSSQSVSVSGGEWRSADDDSGTNATAWTSSAGSVARDKFIQVRHTSSASEVTTTTTTLTVNGYANTWSSTTLDTSAFSFVTNSGSSYSASTGTMSTTTYSRWIFAFRIKSTASTASQTIWNGAAGSNYFLRYDGATGQVRFQFGNSATFSCFINTGVAFNNEVTVVFSLDMTQNLGSAADNFAAGFKAVANGSLVTTSQTAFDTSSGTRKYGLNAISPIGIMDRTDGGGTNLTGEFHFLWVNAFDTAMPDITDPAFYNKFSAQLMNADGSATDATFGQPLLYYTNLNKSSGGTTNNAGSSTTNTTLTNTGAYT